MLPDHLKLWDGLLEGNWPADAGPIPDQNAVVMARRLLGVFEERSRRPDLAIIMYCRPEGASNAQVHMATGRQMAAKAKKLHVNGKLDFMKAEMTDGAVWYFVGPPGSSPWTTNCSRIRTEKRNAFEAANLRRRPR